MAVKPYQDLLDLNLKDWNYAVDYLNAVLEERDFEAFVIALGDVARVHSSVSDLASQADVNRTYLYKIFDEGSNPSADVLFRIMWATGLKMKVCLAP